MTITGYNIVICLCAAGIGFLAFIDDITKRVFFKNIIRRKNYKWIAFFKSLTLKIIVFGVATGFGVWATVAKDNYSETQNKNEKLRFEHNRNKEYQNLLIRTDSILNKNNRLLSSATAIISLEAELAKKNDKIQRLQNEELDNITGGTNIPLVQFVPLNGTGIYGTVRNINNNLPIKNLTIHFTELYMDYFESIGKDTRSTNNPNARKEYNFKIGDLSKGDGGEFLNIKYPKKYSEVMYMYSVRWLNGFYSGTFTIKTSADNDRMTIPDNRIIGYNKGLKLSSVVIVDTQFAKVQPLTK